MGLLCDRDVYAKKPPWQGLAHFQIVYVKKKFRLAKNIVFHQLLMAAEPKTHNTKTNRTVLWKTK